MGRRRRLPRMVAWALCLVLAGCECGGSPTTTPTTTGTAGAAAGCRPPADNDQGKLSVLAGSELGDLTDPDTDKDEGKDILAEVKRQTGVEVELHEIGTRAGVQQVVTEQPADRERPTPHYDAIWFSTNAYLRLLPGGRDKIATENEVMRSPVVLGLTAAKAEELGWRDKDPTWVDILKTAKAPDGPGRKGYFTFGMTEPASSNSGFSTMLALTAAAANSGAAVTKTDIDGVTGELRRFFRRQELFEGSSGWLTDVYAKTGHQRVDGLFNYESELLEYNNRPKDERGPELRVIYPRDGVVMADYPFTLLTSATAAARKRYRAAVDCLLDPAMQQLIVEQTYRRPVNRKVPFPERLQIQDLYLLGRPGQGRDADGLVETFKDKIRRPANAIYVLDISGSMADQAAVPATASDGARLHLKIDQLKDALRRLTGTDTSISASLALFSAREQVTLLRFNHEVFPHVGFTVPADNPEEERGRIKRHVDGWPRVRGDTAIWDALKRAYEIAEVQHDRDSNRFTTIVLLSDGERNTGDSACDFYNFRNDRPEQVRRVRVHVVFLRSQKPARPEKAPPDCPRGGSHEDQMRDLANRTGGKFFDTKDKSLAELFKDIRGYQ